MMVIIGPFHMKVGMHYHPIRGTVDGYSLFLASLEDGMHPVDGSLADKFHSL
jgi:hypothetical protein